MDGAEKEHSQIAPARPGASTAPKHHEQDPETIGLIRNILNTPYWLEGKEKEIQWTLLVKAVEAMAARLRRPRPATPTIPKENTRENEFQELKESI